MATPGAFFSSVIDHVVLATTPEFDTTFKVAEICTGTNFDLEANNDRERQLRDSELRDRVTSKNKLVSGR